MTDTETETEFAEAVAIHPDHTLMTFTYKGQNAYLNIENGELVYSGDLPVADSARLFFTRWLGFIASHGGADEFVDAAYRSFFGENQ